MPAIPMCLVFILDTTERQHRVLLGLKHSGIGAANVVGLGGHIDAGESAPEAAVREVREESGIVVSIGDLHAAGQVRFRFPSKPAWDQDVDIFTTTTWAGEPEPSDEITATWYALHRIPFDAMWDDAHHWLPQVLEGESVNLTVTFNSDNRTVESLA